MFLFVRSHCRNSNCTHMHVAREVLARPVASLMKWGHFLKSGPAMAHLQYSKH